MQAMMGGNLINYPDDIGVPTANLLLVKIFLPKLKMDIPEEVITEYNLHELAMPSHSSDVRLTSG